MAELTPTRRIRGQAFGIDVAQRVPADIAILIGPSLNPNWIRREIPSQSGRVVPIPIVVVPALLIVVLPRKPEVDDRGLAVTVRIVGGRGGAVAVAVPAPLDHAGVVPGQAGRAQVVVLQVQAAGRVGEGGVLDDGEGPLGEPHIGAQGRAVAARLGDQVVVLVVVVEDRLGALGGGRRGALAAAPVAVVVGVGG